MPSDFSWVIELAHLTGLGRAEGRGGLVHDEDLGVEVHGAGDGHRLALPARQRPHRRSCRFLNRGLSRCITFCVADAIAESSSEPAAGEQLAPEEHVAGGVDVVGQRELLVDRLDAVRPRVAGVVDGRRARR